MVKKTSAEFVCFERRTGFSGEEDGGNQDEHCSHSIRDRKTEPFGKASAENKADADAEVPAGQVGGTGSGSAVAWCNIYEQGVVGGENHAVADSE